LKVLTQNIVPEERCLTEDEALRYANGVVSREEARRLDAHLRHCPFCTDAIDGLMLLPIADAQQSLKNIQKFGDDAPKHVQTKENIEKPVLTASKSGSRIRFWLTAAATVVGITGGSFWLLTKGEAEPPTFGDDKTAAETAQNATENASKSQTEFQLKEETPSSTAQTPPPSINAPNPTKSNTNGSVTGSVTTSPSGSTSDIAAVESKQEEAKDFNQNYGKSTEKEVAASSSPAYSTAPAPSGGYDNDVAMKEDVKINENNSKNKVVTARAKPTAPATANNSGLGAMEAAKMRKANFDATNAFQQGAQFLKSKKFDAAIREFEAVLEVETSGDLYELSLLYLADAKFGKGNKAEAQQIWQRIVNEKGKYATRAAEKLK
jgi:TolA-binding protein